MSTNIKHREYGPKVHVSSSDVADMVIGLWEAYWSHKDRGHDLLAEKTYSQIVKYRDKLYTNGYWGTEGWPE